MSARTAAEVPVDVPAADEPMLVINNWRYAGRGAVHSGDGRNLVSTHPSGDQPASTASAVSLVPGGGGR